MYAFSENFVLPFSHDEVVHGKRSMLDKMPGDVWQKHANLRALYGYMFVHPGKKLLFMGGEIGQWREWNHDWQLDWEVLGDPRHAGLQRWVRDLNRVYADEPSLWEVDFDPAGFSWIDCNDHEHSIIALMRRSAPHGRHDSRSPSSTSRRCRGATTASACRQRRVRECSTATPRSTAAATSATRARVIRRRKHPRTATMVARADRPTSGISAAETEQVIRSVLQRDWISSPRRRVADPANSTRKFQPRVLDRHALRYEPKRMVQRGTNGVTNGIRLTAVRGRSIVPP